MTRTQSWLLTACGCFALLAVGVLALQVREDLVSAEKSSSGLLAKTSAAVDTLNATLDHINRPCKGPAGPDACGTLAQVNKVAIDAGDVTVAAQLQVMQSGKLIEAATQNMNQVSTHVDAVADNLALTAKAATGTMAQATADLQTVNGVIGAAQPLVGHLDDVAVGARGSVTDLNAILADPNVSLTMANIQETTAQAAIITKDAKVEEQRFVYPPKTPWYKKIVPTILKAGELAYDFIR